MTDIVERIAILETSHENHREDITDVVDQLKRLNDQVDTINSKLDKNAGFLAGVAFVFTMLGAFIGMGGASVLKKMFGE